MIDTLIFADKQLTLWLNSFHNEFFDAFFYLTTSMPIWIPLYIVLAWFVFQKQGPRGLVTVFFVAMVVVAADQISSSIFKPIFERYRPSQDPTLQYMIHLVNDHRGGRFGFVSSHAANTIGVATFLSLIVRNRFFKYTLFIWALLNCYSRIYAGVHFVGDILCGAVLGLIIGAIFYQIYLRTSLHFFIITHHNKRTLKSGLAEMFGPNAPYIAAGAFWLMLVTICIAAHLITRYHGVAC